MEEIVIGAFLAKDVNEYYWNVFRKDMRDISAVVSYINGLCTSIIENELQFRWNPDVSDMKEAQEKIYKRRHGKCLVKYSVSMLASHLQIIKTLVNFKHETVFEL